jgi:hypothetical protein
MTTSHHYKIFFKEFCTQKMKQTNPWKDRQYQTTGEEKARK